MTRSPAPGDPGGASADAVRPPPWYRAWFGPAYLELYPHRDEDEARRAVDLLLRETSPSPGTRVLDLACGAGRHARALAERGLRPMGIDLSAHLLREARRRSPSIPLVRADMRRLPLAPASVPVLTSFFTSFGYFESEAEDRSVLAEMRRVLEPGGTVLLDFLNAARVRATLEPRDERVVGHRHVTQIRELVEDGRVVRKRILLRPADDPDATPREFLERVRLYPPAELAAILEAEGFRIRSRFGDYDGSPLRESSPRAILLATCGPPSVTPAPGAAS